MSDSESKPEKEKDDSQEKKSKSSTSESSQSSGGQESKVVYKKTLTVELSVKKGGEPKKADDEKDGKKDKEGDDDSEGDQEKDDDEKSDDDKKSDKDKDAKDKDGQKKTPLYKKPVFIVSAIIVFILLTVLCIVLWLILRQYVSTDDAYIDGHVTQVSPQVGARVQVLHIDDNQLVHKGDLLIELDPIDYQVALLQAKAQVASARGRLAQARAQIISAKTEIPEALAREKAAQSSLETATRDLHRYENVDERARSRQQLDSAANNQTNAQAQLEQAHAQVDSAKANVVTAEAAVKAAVGELKTAQANRQRAEVNLSYCQIFAPSDGRVTERTVEPGNYVTVGEALFLLVDPNVWVTANFKETQLTHMQPGQHVTIKVDAFPNHKFSGHIDSIQAGSGSRFSVLPAENATGNYVKVVQRIPVKIYFDHDANTNNAYMLSPGLSVIPRVKVR